MTISETVLACFGIIFFACFVIVLDQKESALYDLKREKDINGWLRNQKRHLHEMLHEANCKIKELEKPKINAAISVDAEEFKSKLKEASDGKVRISETEKVDFKELIEKLDTYTDKAFYNSQKQK